MIEFLIGLMLGGTAGFFLCALFAGRGRDDRDDQ